MANELRPVISSVLFASLHLIAMPGEAEIVVDAKDVNGNVVFSTRAGGSLDLGGMPLTSSSDDFSAGTGVNATISTWQVGGSATMFTPMNCYSGVTGAVAFGPGTGQFELADSADGAALRILSTDEVCVDGAYTSGSAYSGGMLFQNDSINSLGMTEGRYVYQLANDTVTLNVGNQFAYEPEVRLVWKAKNGAPVPPSEIVVASEGDVLDLDIVVSDGGTCTGLDSVFLELNWNPAKLSVPNPTVDAVNNCAGGCFDSGDGVFGAVGAITVDNVTGNASGYNAEKLSGAIPFNSCEGDGDLILGSLRYTVDQAPGMAIRVGYNTAQWPPDGVTTTSPEMLFQPEAIAAIISVPGC